MIYLYLCTVVFSSNLVWAEDCKIGNGGKAEKSRSSALLFAHRCFLKDVPIKVPSPVNTIPDTIIPSHIVVPRCSGKTVSDQGTGLSKLFIPFYHYLSGSNTLFFWMTSNLFNQRFST